MSNDIVTEMWENTAKKANEIEEIEEIIERPYNLRNLKDKDLFPLLKLLRELGLREFKEAFSQIAEGKSISEIGALVVIDIVDIIIANLTRLENEIYDFWSELSGIPAAEIKEMEFGTLPLMITDTFSGVKNTSFFKVLSKLL